ncbi:alpha/beta hydrolase [Cobetia amphilecti]|uniref:alpha/beta hydrolase n=1 Tax=Cobetia amphilecti TaxID=1055104 RepID=UPI00254FF2ED|nr:alpha/beta hydrolase [Cobetia amphilecti]
MSSRSPSHPSSPSTSPSTSSSTSPSSQDSPPPHAEASLHNHDEAHAGLERVIKHLERIKAFTARTGNDLGAKRTLLEAYFAADASILDTGVTPRLAMVPGGEGERVCEVLPAPDDAPARPRRLLHVHGGSWIAGSPAGHRPLASRLGRAARAETYTLDYRLAPEAAFPAGLQDVLAAWRWLCDEYPQDHLLLAGDSAGGNLTLAAVNALKSAGERLPDAVIAFSPATDLSWGSASLSRKAEVDPILDPNLLPFVSMAYVQDGTDMSDPRISPLEGNLFDLPPTLIQCGEAEILLDDSRRYATQAQDCGSPVTLSLWPDMPHVFVGFAPLLSAANAALKEAREFLDTTLS